MTARLLVVDDVPANGRLLEACLSEAYYLVKTVTDSSTVEEAVRDWQPDVILLDVMMPEIDGYQLCRTLKSSPATADIPIIMVTALKEQEERYRGLDVGADEFLVKPVETRILLARLRSIIRLKQLRDEWRARNAAIYSFGLVGNRVEEAETASGAVLIAEDFASRWHHMRKTLEHSGISCQNVKDEAGAMAATEQTSFDLVIISLSLMTEDPLKLLARLKAAAHTRDTPILLIAEPDRQQQLIQGLDLGANDSIAAPLDDAEFLLRARTQIQRKQFQDKLREDVGNALELAAIDPLTNLFNRRYLMNFLERLCANAESGSFAVVMIDIDHFKQINDRFGHPVGDQVLVAMSEVIRSHLRQSDVVARFGGEEFAVVLSHDVDGSQAEHVAEKLRHTIAHTVFEANINASISVGVALRESGVSATTLLDAADKALYEAKRNGRDQVVFYRGDYSEYERRKRSEA